ncbi:hypothetical protein J3R30DRAFT_3515299 [Lentinula aciculospora]|uniref:Uncharacterized protein n=1 Tax=Lentinula aciculospora TaxID=153920 RepID=A0A9W9A2U6_9AGAR|nr:hypothetical protein J3R30DRAFT_3515299 [Lentinula aciculospora]
MTRSLQAKYCPRIVKKTLKRTCLDAGMARNDAEEVSLSCLPAPRASGTTRRNPGRMDGVQWKSNSFICPEHVDGSEPYDDETYEVEKGHSEEDLTNDERRESSERLHIISLLDIARPAKSKGPAKEYEIVKSVRQVIFLDDEPSYLGEEWEDIQEFNDDARETQQQLTYAAVLQSKDELSST